jgi:nitric oxide reductase NorE protein
VGVAEMVSPAPAEDDVARLPGDKDMWVFVLGDLVIFAAYFLVFMIYRVEHRALFLESQRHLNLKTGAVNTLVLLASSRFVALAVVAARASDHRRATRLLSSGIVCAVVFIGIKVGEWATEIGHGFTLPRNAFFMFYYSLTGVHLLHVLLGILVLAIALYDQRNPRLRRVSVVEAGAVYWHMVDVLWIAIFALVYLMR